MGECLYEARVQIQPLIQKLFLLLFFFLNRDVPILKEVAAVLVTTSLHSFLASVTANSHTHPFKSPLNEHNLLNLNHQPP